MPKRVVCPCGRPLFVAGKRLLTPFSSHQRTQRTHLTTFTIEQETKVQRCGRGSPPKQRGHRRLLHKGSDFPRPRKVPCCFAVPCQASDLALLSVDSERTAPPRIKRCPCLPRNGSGRRRPGPLPEHPVSANNQIRSCAGSFGCYLEEMSAWNKAEPAIPENDARGLLRLHR